MAKIPRRPPGGASLLPKPKPSYSVTDAMNDTRARAIPVDGKAFGKDKGFGVYRGKGGKLTYKGTGKTQSAPQKPNDPGASKDAVAKASASAQAQASSRMDEIAGHYRGLAEILQGIGPGVGQAYGDAASQIAGFGQGFSGDFRDRMTANADATQNDIERVTGNYLSDATEAKARGGYDIGAAADVGYGLGAYLGAKSLSEQGAAFSSAARFLPAAAAQQGLYALSAQGKAEAEAAAEAASEAGGDGQAKASASLSKALGYLVDAYGQPILNGKGKPIPIPKEGLTPYQEAQLELSAAREDRYINNENYDRWKTSQDITFRNAQEERRVQADLRRGRQVDSATSKLRGFIVYKDGTIPKGKNGKPIPIVESESSNSPKSKAQKAYQAAVKAAGSTKLKGLPIKSDRPGWYFAKPGMGEKKNVNGKEITTDVTKARTNGFSYMQAFNYLREAYGVTAAAAHRALKSNGWVRPPVKPKNAYTDPSSSKRG